MLEYVRVEGGFFQQKFNNVFFRHLGTVPAESVTFTTFVRAESKSLVHSKRNDVSIQSRSHVFGDISNEVKYHKLKLQ